MTNVKLQMTNYCIIILLSLLFVGQCEAATRFYLPSTGAADVSPAYSASWNDTSNADRLKCVTTKISSAMTNKSTGNTSATGHFLFRQYVSDPISAQTITGTVYGQVAGLEGHAGVNGFSDIIITIVSNDGSMVRGTLLAITSGATEYLVGTAENRKTPVSTAVSVVTAEANDRIVIEVGGLKNGAKKKDIQLIFGDDNAGDLPVDETTQTANNPWVEFSQTIAFAGARRRVILIN